MFGQCPHQHTVKLTDKVDHSKGFLLCESCSTDSDFGNYYNRERI